MDQRKVSWKFLVVAAGVAMGAVFLLRSDTEPAPTASTCLPPGSVIELTGTTETFARVAPAGLVPNVEAMAAAGMGSLGGPVEQVVTERWRLALRAVGMRDGETIVAVEMVDYAGEVDGHPAERALPPPQMLGLDERCAITGFAWQRDLPLDPARKLQVLLAELQFARPGVGDQHDSYTLQAEDSTGEYRAIFQQLPDALLSEQLRYEKVHIQGAQASAVRARVGESWVRVEGAGEDWFGTLERRRDLAIVGPGGEIASVRVRVSARSAMGDSLVDVPTDGWEWGSLLRRVDIEFGVELGTDGVTGEGKAVADPAALDQAIDAWVGLFEQGLPVGGGNYASRVSALAEWLAQNPEAAGPLIELLATGVLDEVYGARSAAFLALGLADVPETRAALLTFINDDDAAMGYRLHAAIGLSSAGVPVPGLMDALEGWVDDPELDPFGRGSAYLVLGALSGQRGDAHPDVRERVAERLRSTLEDPDVSRDDAGFALDAVGNSGDASLVEAVGAYLEGDDPELKRMAADAMRSMPADVVGSRLRESLLGDSPEAVKAAAMRALLSSHRSEPLPEGVVAFVNERVSAAPPLGEYRAGVEFLGRSAGYGDADAEAALRALWEAEMAKRPLDPERLRALGAYTGPH